MKFTTVWSSIASQNMTLRIAIVCLAFVTAILGVIAAKTVTKPPLIVERSCQSKILNTTNGKHTENEMQTFIEEALKQRFDSSNQNSSFLSFKESQFKIQEQKELTNRNMRQRILVDSVKLSDMTVYADRLVSVGDIRSAFNFPLRIVVESTTRSQTNPYGLVLAAVAPLKKEDKLENK